MSATAVASGATRRDSWLPMIVIALGQALLSFNAAALPISMSGMVASFDTPPTTVGTAIVINALGVSAFVLLGAKLGQRFGSRLFFQASATLFLVAMILVMASPTARIMLAAQGLAGLAGAAMVPTLVVLIANHYHSEQQCEALGWLGSARAMAGALAFLVIGTLERFVSWRYAFALLTLLSAAIIVLSFRLKPSNSRSDLKIDFIGLLLSALTMVLITYGVNSLTKWGVLYARPSAPYAIYGFSPALLFVGFGIVVGFAFLAWTRRRVARGETALIALSIVEAPMERATILAMFLVGAMEAAMNFTMPLYVQIVQGQDAFQTALAMMPLKLAAFSTAILIVRFYRRFTPRGIASCAFAVVAAGSFWLAVVVRNDWSTFPVVLGLITFGIGTGALVTLLFNVLITSRPKTLSGDVGALRGAASNLSTSVGTALVGALAVGVLSAAVMRRLEMNPVITTTLRDQVNLDSINFFSNERLAERLQHTTATPEQVAEAIRINNEARLRALKFAFLVLGAVSLLAILPSRRLPGYTPGEVPG